MNRKASATLLLILSLLLTFQAAASAYTHHDSLIRWREYSPKAFSDASKDNKPILMLITAVWCYWCKVFEEQTLETRDVSDYINSNFIPVFVDYDRRKDLVRKYPSYGLPSTLILTPGGQPLRALPGYMDKKNFTARLDEVLKRAWADYRPGTPPEEAATASVKLPTVRELKLFRDGFRGILQRSYDSEYGGFGAEIKEPYGRTLYYALELYRETGDEDLKEMVVHTLDRIAGLKKDSPDGQRPAADYLLDLYRNKNQEGWFDKVESLQRQHRIVGILDPAEKGFFRLAILRDWGIPHYEKLLSVNAEMVDAYILAHAVTKKPEYKEIAIGTLDYLLDKLYDPKSGRFYGSQAADAIYYHLTKEERRQVKPPAVDATSYAAASAEIVETLLYAYKTFGDDRYRESARKGLQFIEKELIGKRGAMSYYDPRDGRAHIDGQLIDNARVASAFLKAAETLGDKGYLRPGLSLIDFSLKELYDPKGGAFFERNSTSREFYKEGEAVSRGKPFDANGLMALNLIKAYKLTKKEVYLQKAKETLSVFAGGEIDPRAPYLLQAAAEIAPLLNAPAK